MTEIITNLIKADSPCLFAKFGDGEYACAHGYMGSNCDGDNYNNKLSQGIRDAIIYYSDNKDKNIFAGMWNHSRVSEFFQSICKNPINWLNYHVFVMDEDSFKSNVKLEIYRAIQNSQRKKIIISNEALVKANIFLKTSHHIIVPFRNWFEKDFNTILEHAMELIGDNENPMIFTCCGMSAKVLLMELHKRKPYGIFLDLGSALDLLCTGKCSRGNRFSCKDLETYFSELLPTDWNDEKYSYIKNLHHEIGLHLI